MARNVIDALVVTLGLDPKGFKKGQAEAVEALDKTRKTAETTDKAIRGSQAKTARAMHETGETAGRIAKGLQAHGKEGAEFFDQLTRAGLKLLGVITAGRALKDFAVDTITSSAAQGRLATNLGLSTSALTAYGAAVKQFAGGNKNTAETTMGSLLQSYQQFRLTGTPSQSMMVMSRFLGLPLSDLRPKNFNTLIGDLATKFHGMKPQRAYAVGHAMGFDDGTINFLRLGKAQVMKDLAKSKREGTTTRKQAEAMKHLQTAILGVEQASETLGRTLLTKVAPGLIRVAHVIQDVLEGNWSQLNKDLAPPHQTSATSAARHLLFGLSAKQGSTRMQIMNALVAAGMSPVNAAASAGNAQAESSFHPNIRTYDPKHHSYHYGLWQVSEQWRQKILAATGIDMWRGSAAQQAKGYYWALKHDPFHTLRKIRGSHSANASAQTIDSSFERSGDSPLKQMQRGTYGDAAYAAWKRKHPALPSSVTSVVNGLRAGAAVQHNTSVTSSTHIGQITVHTQAKDANGIAASIGHSLKRRGLATQANGGLS